MKVDAIPITAETETGETIPGLECSACGEEFFDIVTVEAFPRIVETAVAQFIKHADHEHHSTGGVFNGRRQSGRMCA
jgi:hypothetical protein